MLGLLFMFLVFFGVLLCDVLIGWFGGMIVFVLIFVLLFLLIVGIVLFWECLCCSVYM